MRRANLKNDAPAMDVAPSGKSELLDPPRQEMSASSTTWYQFLLTVLLAAACSVLLHWLKPSSPLNPFTATTLLFFWWLVTSYAYLRLSLGKSLTGSAFLHWLLLTPRLRLLLPCRAGGGFSIQRPAGECPAAVQRTRAGLAGVLRQPGESARRAPRRRTEASRRGLRGHLAALVRWP